MALGRAIDLDAEHRLFVLSLLTAHVPHCEVRAYGSRVKWTAGPYSDLDLAIVSNGQLSPLSLLELREALDESDLPFSVDVLDWRSIPDSFRGEIDQDYVVIKEAQVLGEWSELSIGEISDVVGGGTPSTKEPENFDGNIPWLTPRDLSKQHERYVSRGKRNLSEQGLARSSATMLPPRSVLLTTRAPIGYVALANDLISTNQGFRSLVVREGYSPEFIYYWLLANKGELERHASGSTFQELSGSALKSIRIRVPAVAEQRRIASALSGLDDKIELDRRMCETLEQMARELFKAWFVDFEPVQAKLEDRWREDESLPSLPAKMHPLFPDHLVDSELGPIPAGWRVAGLDEIADFTNGLALQRFPAEEDEYLPVIKIAEMRRGYTDRTDKCSVKLDPKYVVDDGDLLFSWSGSLEVVLWSHGRGALNQHLFKVTSAHFPRWFYWGWINKYLQEFQGIASGKARTMGHIRRHHLRDVKVCVPPLQLLDFAGESITPMIQAAVHCAVQARQTATLRAVVLPKLISGELRLPPNAAINPDNSDVSPRLAAQSGPRTP